MSVLPIVTVPDKKLSLYSEEVKEVDQSIKKLVDDMFETMHANQGLGLAAVQVGIHKRILVVNVPEELGNSEDIKNKIEGYELYGGPYCIINPKIVDLSEEKINLREGCLSVPGYFDYVVRSQYVTVQYLDYNGNECIIRAQGWLARCLEHEIDHLNGIVFLKYLSKFKRDFAIEKVRKKEQTDLL
ncbi:peptide deformylase [Ehrlichia japonica]|uniref:Peptide deformylase n=1 Tax=Ehrlichia japonica TaxID=391036 RepID=X5GJU1_9RICK|nr:peptide deformylase [Ehrlichia japonica]AHX04723.1 peptide deformylase [Ehrlichia japonica]